MITNARQERPSRTALGRCLMDSGALTSDWAPAFAAVDRAVFLPDLMWPYDSGTRTAVAVHRHTDPAAWYGYADSDVPLVTQWDDGRHRGPGPGTLATSSSSQPTTVFTLLRELDADAEMRVLDAGTGTGDRRPSRPPLRRPDGDHCRGRPGSGCPGP